MLKRAEIGSICIRCSGRMQPKRDLDPIHGEDSPAISNVDPHPHHHLWTNWIPFPQFSLQRKLQKKGKKIVTMCPLPLTYCPMCTRQGKGCRPPFDQPTNFQTIRAATYRTILPRWLWNRRRLGWMEHEQKQMLYSDLNHSNKGFGQYQNSYPIQTRYLKL